MLFLYTDNIYISLLSMGNFGWTIKTGDLLRHIGTEDVIDFEHKDIDNDSITISPP